jgi:transposase
MERASLERLIANGISLAEIGRRFGVHESTVGYWVKRHGLEAANASAHAAKGALPRAELERLAAAGMSVAQIARRVERSNATVRYWLRRHGVKTYAQQRRAGPASTRAAKAAGRATVMRKCREHGVTEFWLEGRGYYRCKRCRMERVSRRRRQVKRTLVEEAGGRCLLCGYARCTAALHFHHVDPESKQFHLSMQGVTRSLARARAEMAKCVLLCANCHAEVEAGVATLEGPASEYEDVA